jgi:putative DNA primase/helicase
MKKSEVIEGPWFDPNDPGPLSAGDYFTQSSPAPKKPSQAVFRIDMSEDDIANHFATLYADELRYDHSRGRWFIWCGTHWKADETGEVFDRIRNYCSSKAAGAATPADQRRLTSVKNARSIETFAQVDRRLAVAQDHWDRDHYLMATPGGTVDLATGILRPNDPNDLISKSASIAPANRAHCPTWLRFVDEACAGKQDQIAFLQKMAGYALTGDTREHSLFFVYGPGGNGKSVLINILTAIMQDYAITAPIETFTAQKGESHPTELAMLAGARLVTASETEEGKRWAESRIKALTGGDPITARFMRQDFFTFKPIFKLLIIGNHMPALNSVDDAARRRFRLVPFENKPQLVDKLLEHKLRDELPGIFRWAIEGCLAWKQNGLEPPQAIREATNKYFSEQDILQQWLDERCVIEAGQRCDTTFAFIDWTKFAEEQGEYVGKKKDLSSRLAKKGIETKLAKINGKVLRTYNNLRLKHGNSL